MISVSREEARVRKDLGLLFGKLGFESLHDTNPERECQWGVGGSQVAATSVYLSF